MKKILISIAIAIISIILASIICLTSLYFSADMAQPEVSIDIADYEISEKNDTTYCRDSYIFKNKYDIYELYIKGSDQNKGAKQGALTKNLMKYQEDVFMNQIKNIIPSDNYLSFLHKFLVIFNRNLGIHIPLEYRNEIVAMSEFCTNEYNAIGNPYERQLNYHGAHDIGHTMQQYMLVGCSSFATWGNMSEDNKLIIGRNFDFYVGDDFAKNKIITFAIPENGYKYVSIGWAGMIGVLSGMNEMGITVTINAGKGAIPTSSATPISILTRNILQYASNIDEAYNIAKQYKTFVSESILVGSAVDNKTAIIEKTPDKIDICYKQNSIICTNHFQSKLFENDTYNIENIKTSDSKYRFDRINELINELRPLNHLKAISILRNRYGINNEDIGIGNEMSINQSIAHHSVIFKPQDSIIWISSSPWQSGTFMCYNLKDFFSYGYPPKVIEEWNIPTDSIFINNDYPNLLKYREGIKTIKKAITENNNVDEEYINKDFQNINPKNYYTWQLIGKYYQSIDDKQKARNYYLKVITSCKIPNKIEKEKIENEINKLSKEIRHAK